MIVKKLSIEGFDKIWMFHVEHSQNFQISQDALKNYLSIPQYNIFAITDANDDILGYIITQIAYDVVDIIHICTHTQRRRQGIATKLLECSTWNIPKNAKIFLEVITDNLPAISLYKKHGFTILSTRKKYSNSKDAYLMARNNDS
jgi:ribosomal-protein-alanine N-acetyltransferase